MGNTLTSVRSKWDANKELKAAKVDARLKELTTRMLALQQQEGIKSKLLDKAKEQLNMYILTKYPIMASKLV